MNAKLLFKTLLLLLVLGLLVWIGKSNPGTVSFALPPLLPKAVKLAGGMMYFVFFAIGVLTGVVLTAGGGKKGPTGSAKPAKAAK